MPDSLPRLLRAQIAFSNLFNESGESGSAATAFGIGIGCVQMRTRDYESATGRGDERGLSLEEKAVQRNKDEHSWRSSAVLPGPAGGGRNY